jgi:hypothetical protein
VVHMVDLEQQCPATQLCTTVPGGGEACVVSYLNFFVDSEGQALYVSGLSCSAFLYSCMDRWAC